MKSLATILLSVHLLLVGFLPNADVHELGKLPNLVAHFLEHETDNNASLAGFIAVHYGSTKSGPQEHQDHSHSELPFQDHNHALHSHAFLIPAPAIEWMAGRIYFETERFSMYALSPFSQYPEAIFQPPRA